MEKGAISKILDYYFDKPKFEKDIFRALRIFFNQPKLKEVDELEILEQDKGMLNEWLVFDFKLSNGKTLLEDFYERNPYKLNIVRLQGYKGLQENYFGIYKVKEVQLGEGLTLENIKTHKVYQVREYSATFSLSEGQVFSARVGLVGDHYELVGADPSFGPVRLNDELESSLGEDKKELNPKTLRDLLFNGNDSQNTAEVKKFQSLKEAEDYMKNILVKYGLDSFVTVEIIKEWIYNHSDDSLNLELNMLCSLLHTDMKGYNDALMEIGNNFGYFYNLCPQKRLWDLTSYEKCEEREKKDIPPDLKISRSELPFYGWGKKYDEALQCMRQVQFKKALKKFNDALFYLLKHQITYPEIYRLYANKGTCHLALGEVEVGVFMLRISSRLNSFYDFAKQQLEWCEENYFIPIYKRKTKGSRKILHDIGFQYDKFLKPFQINFSHIPKDPSAIANIKLGRSRK